MTKEDDRAPERDGYRYPLYRRNDRQLPEAWSGPVYVWDIDNTYLHTRWRSLRDLIRIRFEDALDKHPVPGAVELLAGLRRAVDGERPALYFVSASPKTMREVLEKRMLIDGVVHDGISFRDWHKVRYLRDIFGYKVVALLLLRLETPAGVREHLFGDDREHDPQVYSLYARICAGEVRGDRLQQLLEARGVRSSAARYIVTLAGELPERDPVEWIFIRRLRPDKPLREPDPDIPTHARVVFVDDYAQAAALLHATGRIGRDELVRVLEAVRAAGGGEAPLAAVEAQQELLPAAGVQAAREAIHTTNREQGTE